MGVVTFPTLRFPLLVLFVGLLSAQPSRAGTSTVVFYNVFPGTQNFVIHYVNSTTQEGCDFQEQAWRTASKISTAPVPYGGSVSFTTACQVLVYDILDANINSPAATGNMEFLKLHLLDTDFVNLVGVERDSAGAPKLSLPRPNPPPWSADNNKAVITVLNTYGAECSVSSAAGTQWLDGNNAESVGVFSTSQGTTSTKTCDDALRRDPSDVPASGGCGYLDSSAMRFTCGGVPKEVVLSGASDLCLNSALLVVASGIPGDANYPLTLHKIQGDPAKCASSCAGLLSASVSECSGSITGPLESPSAQTTSASVVFFNIMPDDERYFLSYAPDGSCQDEAAYLAAKGDGTTIHTTSLFYKSQLSISTSCTTFYFQIVKVVDDVEEPINGDVFFVKLVDSDYVNLIGVALGPQGEPEMVAPRLQDAPWSVHSDRMAYQVLNHYDASCRIVIGGSQEFVEAATMENNPESFLELPAKGQSSTQVTCQDMLSIRPGDDLTTPVCGYSPGLNMRVRCNGDIQDEEISMMNHLCLNSNLLIAIHGKVGDPTFPLQISLVSGDPFPFIMCEDSCADIIYTETGCEEYKLDRAYGPSSSLPTFQRALVAIFVTLSLILVRLDFL